MASAHVLRRRYHTKQIIFITEHRIQKNVYYIVEILNTISIVQKQYFTGERFMQMNLKKF